MTDDFEALQFHKEKLNTAVETAKHTHNDSCEHETAEAAIDFHTEARLDHLDKIIEKQQKEYDL